MKTAAIFFSTAKAGSTRQKHRGQGNDVKDMQKERTHRNKLQEILKNQRKHKRIGKLERRHQGSKKGHEGKCRRIWTVNGRQEGIQQSRNCNINKYSMVLWKRCGLSGMSVCGVITNLK